MTSRTFGIELEFVGNLRDASNCLNNVGLGCNVEGYNHITRPQWKVVLDGSVSGGGELVSPILSGEAGIEAAKLAATALTVSGARVNKACGFHVHVSIADFNLRQAKMLVKMFAKYEDVIDTFVAPSRRGTANGYCRSNWNVHPYNTANGNLANDSAKHAAACTSLFRRIDACTSIQEVMDVYGVIMSSRYQKLNLRAYYRHRTIEFRQHQGTVDAEKVAMWVEFCLYLVECAKTTTTLLPRKDDGKYGKDRFALLFGGKHRPEMRQFFAKRAKEFRDREAR
jgi:hypothetical protein